MKPGEVISAIRHRVHALRAASKVPYPVILGALPYAAVHKASFALWEVSYP